MGTLQVNGNIKASGTISSGDNSLVMSTNGSLTTYLSTTGGWACGWHYTVNDTSMGGFGFYGNGSTKINSFYIGTYSSPWMSVTPAGTVTATTFSGSLSGNASTATKLATARTISLTGSVTGSGSFDGSGNLSIATTTNHTHSYLPLSGGTITGSVTFSKSNNYYDIATGTGGSILLNNGDIAGVNSIYFKDAANSVGEGLMFYRSATTVDALRAYNGVLYFSPNYDSAAGTQDGNYTVVHSGNYTNYQVNTDTKVRQSRSTSTNWRPLLSHYTATSQGTNPEAATDIVYYNEKASIQPSTGKIYSAGGFIGNASTATKLATARKISLTGSVTGSGSFDGSGNLSIATTTNHSHSYVPLSGGSMSGQLSISINSSGTSPSTQHIILNGKNDSTAVANAPGLAMHIGNKNWSTLKFLSDGSWRFYNDRCNGYVPIYCSKTVISNYGSTLPSSGAKGEVFFKI